MSDIIDINVTPTIEQVEISVTENLTTVNINTIQQSGDINAVKLTGNQTVEDVKTFVASPIVPTATQPTQAVNLGQLGNKVDKVTGKSLILDTEITRLASVENFDNSANELALNDRISRSGTTEGNPITGGLEFLIGRTIYASNGDGLTFGANGIAMTSNGQELNFKPSGLEVVGIAMDGSRGIFGTDDFSPNITDLDYPQKIYVDSALATKLDASAYNDRFKGKFTTLQQLETALPTASTGDYAQVDAGAGSLVRNYNYDLEDGWVLGGTGAGATSTDTLIEGSTNLYFTTARVLSTLLTGISFVIGTAVTAADSFLIAIGKLQKQNTDLIFALTLKANIAGQNFTGPITATNLSGTNTGDNNENNVYLQHDFLNTASNDFVGFAPINSGTTAGSNTNATPNNVGILRITSSTTANSGVSIRSGGFNFVLKGGEVFTEIINPLLFTNTTNRMGIHDSTNSAEPASGVYFEYVGNGAISLRTANGGSRNTATTITTLALNTWFKVRFTVNANATSILGEVFNNVGVLIASQTVTTNIPTTARLLNVCSIVTNSGTVALPLLDVDFISTRLTLTR